MSSLSEAPSLVLPDANIYSRYRGLQNNCLLSPRSVAPTNSHSTSSNPPREIPKEPSPICVPLPRANTSHSRPETPPASPLKLDFTLPSISFPAPESGNLTPVSPQLNITVHPFEVQDAQAVAVVYEHAFATDSMRLAIMRPHLDDPSSPLSERKWRVGTYEKALMLPGTRIVKAVDNADGGKIVGAVGFFGAGGLQWLVPQQNGNDEGDGMPKHWDRELHQYYLRVVKEKRDEIINGNYNVWELAQMFVEPSYQRRGIGKQMLEWGLQQADAEGSPVYLEATAAGKLLYEQANFVVRNVVKFPEILNNDGSEYTVHLMLRQPQASS